MRGGDVSVVYVYVRRHIDNVCTSGHLYSTDTGYTPGVPRWSSEANKHFPTVTLVHLHLSPADISTRRPEHSTRSSATWAVDNTSDGIALGCGCLVRVVGNGRRGVVGKTPFCNLGPQILILLEADVVFSDVPGRVRDLFSDRGSSRSSYDVPEASYSPESFHIVPCYTWARRRHALHCQPAATGIHLWNSGVPWRWYI